MPGFILHLTAAQMLRSHLHEYPDFPYPIQSVNENSSPKHWNQKEEIATVYIRNFQTYIPFEKYLTEEYYYGDYTKMNTYLVNRYQIPLDLNPQIINPGINEIQFGNF